MILATPTATRAWAVPALVFLASLLLYRLLAQPGLHHLDSMFVLRSVATGQSEHPWHILALVPFEWAHALLQPLGASALESCRWVTALGGALLVACAFRCAETWGLPRRAVWFVTALVATTPAVSYFATIVELQGPVLGLCGMSTLAFARLGQGPGRGRAAVLGVCTGIAAAVHSSLHLLPVVWPLLVLAGAWPRRDRDRIVGPLLLATLVHAAVYLAVWWTFATGDAGIRRPARMLFDAAFARDVATLTLRRTLQEFLLPFVPGSALLLAAAVTGRAKRSVWLLAAAAPGLGATLALLGTADLDERGYCLLYLPLPLAWFCASRVPARWWPWLLGIALLGSVHLRVDQARRRPCPPEVAAGVQELARQQPFVLVTDDEIVLDAVTVFAPEVPLLHVNETMFPRGDDTALVAAAFDRMLELVAPLAAVVDARTWQRWRAGGHSALRQLVERHVPEGYRVREVATPGFRGYVIDRR